METMEAPTCEPLLRPHPIAHTHHLMIHHLRVVYGTHPSRGRAGFPHVYAFGCVYGLYIMYYVHTSYTMRVYIDVELGRIYCTHITRTQQIGTTARMLCHRRAPEKLMEMRARERSAAAVCRQRKNSTTHPLGRDMSLLAVCACKQQTYVIQSQTIHTHTRAPRCPFPPNGRAARYCAFFGDDDDGMVNTLCGAA